MSEHEHVEVELVSNPIAFPKEANDFESIIYDLDSQIEMLSSKADNWDCLVAVGSGVLCGMMDILWVGDFSLTEGREISSENVEEFVKKIAKQQKFESRDGSYNIKDCVAYLEKKFPIPADGNTPEFGGGLQHHLRDFAHHPTIVGLIFSLLTQFTGKSYGTNEYGIFTIVDLPKNSRDFIGKDISSKIKNGTIIWFFHLVSDIAGSKNTAGLSGGTGIPGPILSLAKEISALPIFKDMKVNDVSFSAFLQKLFNGTLLAEHDENGKIIKDSIVKLDFRGELGILEEVKKQAIPVIANECIVRTFYMIRQLAEQIKQIHVTSIEDFKQIDVKKILPFNSPTVTRMLTIATGVFTALDVSDAVATQKYWVSVNYVGVGRFTLALDDEMVLALKQRDIKQIKEMYEEIYRNTYTDTDQKIYERMGDGMQVNKFGLTEEQTEILYNLEFYKTLSDIQTKTLVNSEKIYQLKLEWAKEWQSYMSKGYSGFINRPNAELKWYSLEELNERIKANDPSKPWFRLALLEAMLFEPYFPISTEIDKKGKEVPSKKYAPLNNPGAGYNKSVGDEFLDLVFARKFYQDGYVKRLRKSYKKACNELNEVRKTVVKTIGITAIGLIIALATAGAFAPSIAVALVGSNFVGLEGAALTSACLAYLGGGAVLAGGAGMAGGIMTVVGGGAILGLSVGASVGGITGAMSLMNKKNTILQSAKLMVSVKEVFLNDEKDIEYSDTIYEQYVNKITSIEKSLVELRLKAEVADKETKKNLTEQIKNAEDSVNAMKIAMKSMNRFISSYKTGIEVDKAQKEIDYE